MRVNNKGGVTPRDRRLDRRIVAVAAMAAILLCATTSQAANTAFTINTAASSLTLNIDIYLGPGFPDGAHEYHFTGIQDLQGDQFGGSPPANANVNNLISGSFTGTAIGIPGTRRLDAPA